MYLSLGEVLKTITLKLVEFSQPKFYLLFGRLHCVSNNVTFDLVALQNMKTAAEAVFNNSLQNQSVQLSDPDKDPLNSTTVVTVVEHLHDVMMAVREVFTETEWHLRWQKLARRLHHYLRPILLFLPIYM